MTTQRLRERAEQGKAAPAARLRDAGRLVRCRRGRKRRSASRNHKAMGARQWSAGVQRHVQEGQRTESASGRDAVDFCFIICTFAIG